MIRYKRVRTAFIAFTFAAFVIHSTIMSGQKTANQYVDDVLLKAEIVSSNIQQAIRDHFRSDANLRLTKQLPEDKRPDPGILIKKDGSISFDQTPGQHARRLMEELRQGIHQLQSVEKPSGLDGIALEGAREYWPKVRDISCSESPGIRYYDLDGFEQFCPEH